MMNWKEIPEIKAKHEELAKIERDIVKLKIEYFKSALFRHFPDEVGL